MAIEITPKNINICNLTKFNQISINVPALTEMKQKLLLLAHANAANYYSTSSNVILSFTEKLF